MKVFKVRVYYADVHAILEYKGEFASIAEAIEWYTSRPRYEGAMRIIEVKEMRVKL